MNALLTEAFAKYEDRVAQIAKLREDLRAAEVDRDYWREQIIERCRGASAPKVAPSKPTTQPEKPKASPAPKAPPVSSAPVAAITWTVGAAKRLGESLDGYGSVIGQIVAEGGSVPVDRMPMAGGGGGFLTVSGVAGACAAIRAKARKRGFPGEFIGERAGRVVLDPGLVAAWRAWMEPHREERALRSAIDPEAGS